jgi:hypothetical protein
MNKSFLIGIVSALIIAIATLFFPIELYDGIAIYASGEMVDEKLSLSYLINKTNYLKDYENIGLIDLQLKTVGWVFVGLINLGLPILIGYRYHLYQHSKRNV